MNKFFIVLTTIVLYVNCLTVIYVLSYVLVGKIKIVWCNRKTFRRKNYDWTKKLEEAE